jgi:hypothetical protein
MDEFVHPPRRPFRPTPKLDQIKTVSSQPAPKIDIPTPPPSLPSIPDVPEKTESETSIKIIPDKKDPFMSKYRIKLKGRHLPVKKILIIAGAIILVLIIAGAAYWFFVKRDTQKKPVLTSITPTPKVTPTPTPKVVSPLTGIVLPNAALATRPVTGLMIENSYDARPQSGLNDAGVVFEAIAEGGITRFLALFQESQPQYIGPVRSIRPYYIDFAMPFDAAVGHVGGSPDALNDIKTLGMKDLDQFVNGDTYWRITERFAPHNVYTSFDKLDALNKIKGYSSSKFTAFVRKADVPQTATANQIDFSISSPLYSPRFQYDATTNSYKRFQDGTAHIDLKSNAQITPKVVIALVMNMSLMADGSHTIYQDLGSNKMYVFQDGIVSEGVWQKTDRKSQFVFTDKNGLPMKLNAGQTWISIVDSTGDVSFRS